MTYSALGWEHRGEGSIANPARATSEKKIFPPAAAAGDDHGLYENEPAIRSAAATPVS